MELSEDGVRAKAPGLLLVKIVFTFGQIKILMKKAIFTWVLFFGTLNLLAQTLFLDEHDRYPEKVIYSKDGSLFLAIYAYKAVIFDHLNSPKATIKTSYGIRNASFSPDNNLLVTVESGHFKLWKTNGAFILELPAPASRMSVSGIDFSADGTRIAAGLYDNKFLIWNTKGEQIALLNHDHPLEKETIEEENPPGFDPINRYRGLYDPKRQHREITCLRFTQNGRIFSASEDRSAFLWDPSGRAALKIENPYAAIVAVDFSKDGKSFITGHSDGKVVMWNNQGKILHTNTELNASIVYLKFSPLEDFYTAASNDGVVLEKKKNQQIIRTFRVAEEQYINLMALSPNAVKAAYTVHITGFYIKNLNKNKHINKAIGAHWGPVSTVAVSPDGKKILSGGTDKYAILWDLFDTPLYRFPRFNQNVTCAVFANDSKSIFIGTEGNDLTRWDTTGFLMRKFVGHNSGINAIGISKDGKFLLTASKDSTAILWDINEAKIISRFLGHQASVQELAISNNGKSILTGDANGTIILWDLNGKIIRKFEHHRAEITGLNFTPDGQKFISASEDEGLFLLDFKGNVATKFEGNENPIRSLAMFPDGKKIVTSGTYELCIWNFDGTIYKKFKGSTINLFNTVAIAPDAAFIATGNLRNGISFWNPTNGYLKTYEGPESFIRSMSVNANNLIVVRGLDNRIYIWNIHGKLIKKFDLYPEEQLGQTFLLPDNKTLIVAKSNGMVQLLTDSLKVVSRFYHPGLTQITYSSNGQYVLSGGIDGIVSLRDLSHLDQPVHLKNHKAGISVLVFSPDGQYFLSGSADSTAILWDTQGKKILHLKDDNGSITSLGFSRDSKKIILGNSDGKVSLWDIAGNKITSFNVGFSNVNTVLFSPGGKSIYTITRHSGLMQWDLNGKPIIHHPIYGFDTMVFSKDGKYGFMGYANQPIIKVFEVDED